MTRRERPKVRVSIRAQTDEEARRFSAAVDLFLADLVAPLIDGVTKEADGREGSERQAIHRPASLQ